MRTILTLAGAIQRLPLDSLRASLSSNLPRKILQPPTVHPSLPFQGTVNYRDPSATSVTGGDDVPIVEFVELSVLRSRAGSDGEVTVAIRVEAGNCAAGAPSRLTIATFVGEGYIRRCYSAVRMVTETPPSFRWPFLARHALTATTCTFQPWHTNSMRSPWLSRMPTSSSDTLEQYVEIERGSLAEVVGVSGKEGFGRFAPFVPQHGKEGPFGVELGRKAEIDHHIA